MATFPIEEVEAAFRTFWRTGNVTEQWDAWADLFTEDVVYHERVLGSMYGRAAVRAWILPLMEQYGEIYGVYEWHVADPSGRVVVYMQNRRDDPGGGKAFDFPGITILQYAGDGRWSMEEDYWAQHESKAAYKAWSEACKQHDPDHRLRRTRFDWGNAPDWARGPRFAEQPRWKR